MSGTQKPFHHLQEYVGSLEVCYFIYEIFIIKTYLEHWLFLLLLMLMLWLKMKKQQELKEKKEAQKDQKHQHYLRDPCLCCVAKITIQFFCNAVNLYYICYYINICIF